MGCGLSKKSEEKDEFEKRLDKILSGRNTNEISEKDITYVLNRFKMPNDVGCLYAGRFIIKLRQNIYNWVSTAKFYMIINLAFKDWLIFFNLGGLLTENEEFLVHFLPKGSEAKQDDMIIHVELSMLYSAYIKQYAKVSLFKTALRSHPNSSNYLQEISTDDLLELEKNLDKLLVLSQAIFKKTSVCKKINIYKQMFVKILYGDFSYINSLQFLILLKLMELKRMENMNLNQLDSVGMTVVKYNQVLGGLMAMIKDVEIAFRIKTPLTYLRLPPEKITFLAQYFVKRKEESPLVIFPLRENQMNISENSDSNQENLVLVKKEVIPVTVTHIYSVNVKSDQVTSRPAENSTQELQLVKY